MTSLIKWVVKHNHISYGKRFMCSKPMNPLKPLPKYVNSVKLIGEISTEVYKMRDERMGRIFFLKTKEKKDFYDVHKIVLPSYTMENVPKAPEPGDIVYIGGLVRAPRFDMDNGKKGTAFSIIAQQLYFIDEPAPDNPIVNQNHIELTSRICFEVSNQENYSEFTVAYQHYMKDSDGEKFVHTDFITVFVYDEILRNIVRTQFNRLDLVTLEGCLKYKSCVDVHGKKQHKGYIQATKLAKLHKFTHRPSVQRRA